MKETEERHYAFFSNRQCEFFPCHDGADPEAFNCLFCYCPLYVLGCACGGTYTVLENGVKDCRKCLYPHFPENYDSIVSRWKEIAEKTAVNSGETSKVGE